jgi:glycosyltransferase involved in cell wall biosynthesis
MKIDIDVIIPVYNGEKFISNTISSVLQQTYKPRNIIVVNDGSTDTTAEMIDSFKNSGTPVIHLKKENKGLSAARNSGLALAKSAWVAFLDADDKWEPTKLEKQIQCLRQSKLKDLGVIYCDYKTINEQGTFLLKEFSQRIAPALKGNIFNELLSGNRISGSGSSILVKRACFKKVGLFDETLPAAEDWDMLLRLARHYAFDFIPAQLVSIRIHSTNMQKNYANVLIGKTLVIDKLIHSSDTIGKKIINNVKQHIFDQILNCFPNQPFQKALKERISKKMSELIFSNLYPDLFIYKTTALIKRFLKIFKSADKPLISVVMPAYNAELFIKDSIASILEQTYKNFELLIINDGSTDNTLKIAGSFNDPRINIVSNKKNLGLNKTLNIGIANAKGKYIARLDADDLAYKHRLKLQIKILEKYEDAGLVASGTEVIDSNGKSRGYSEYCFKPEEIFYILHFRNCLTHSSVMFSKDLVKMLGGYAENIEAEDLELWHKIAGVSKIYFIKKALVKWREYRLSKSALSANTLEKSAVRLCQQKVQKITNNKYKLSLIENIFNIHQGKIGKKILTKNCFNEYLQIAQSVLNDLPAFYDQKILKNYLKIEYFKYSLFLKGTGAELNIDHNISLKEKFLGYYYYLLNRTSSRQKKPILRLFAKLDHLFKNSGLLKNSHF